jgi:hypothetical protein
MTELHPTGEHNVTLTDQEADFKFFGEPVPFKNVAWYFPSLELHSTEDELKRLAAIPGDEVRVTYRTPPGTRPLVRLLSDDEMIAMQSVSAGETVVPGEAKIRVNRQNVGFWQYSSRPKGKLPAARPNRKKRRK